MKVNIHRTLLPILSVAGLAAFGLTACDDSAGDAIEDAAEDVEEGAEEVGDKIEDAVDDLDDK